MAKITTYIKESYEELVTKVTWPAMKDLQSSAVAVLVATILFSLLIFVMDFAFGVQTPDATGGFAWKGVLGFLYDMIQS